MGALLKKYGEYIIEPGTLLFRKAANRELHDTMFFGFCPIGPHTSNIRSNSVQVWKTKKEIRSLLMLKGRSFHEEEPFLFSAIVDIYNRYFPDDLRHEYQDLNLKKHDTVFRRRLIRRLKEQNIISWVCSAEDNFVVELFLFAAASDHQQLVSYVESYKDFTGYPRKEFVNSFNYEKVKHLPIIKKGPPPGDPFTDWLMFGEKDFPDNSLPEPSKP